MMLADTLATHHGLQILIVDLDPQANASQMILSFAGLKRAKSAGKTLATWVQALAKQEREDFFEAITPDVCGIEEVRAHRSFGWNSNRERGDTAIVAATPELRFAEMEYDQRRFEPSNPSASRHAMTSSLRKGIASLGRAYDLVIFDCPPGFTTLAQSAIAMADAIISPMFEDPVTLWSLVSFREFGLKQTLNVWDRERHRVLFTRVVASGAKSPRRYESGVFDPASPH
jgi:cellulose biosynthesis protein BcsQ